MATRAPTASDQFYHVYNRGTEKRKTFLSKRDYERFLALLYLANSTEPVRVDNINRNEQGPTLLRRAMELERGEPLVSIASYCLMPNHFHILLRPQAEAGLSRFMQKLCTAYTMYFNTRYQRSGALFQGKYKIRHAEGDRYLKYLIAYIHLNPAKISDPTNYPHSSYADFAGEERPHGKILDKTALPFYFETPAQFKKEMHEWLTYQEEEHRT
jgi:REP element-mobilizing transposase RayT